MLKTISFIAIALLFSIADPVMAQNSLKWDLQKCIDYALENNITIKQQSVQTEILSNNLYQSKFNRLPNLSGSANQNYNIGRSIDPFTNTFSTSTIQSNSFTLGSGMTLFAGNRINNTIKMNEVAVAANEEGVAATRNQIANSVALAYLQIIMAEENLKTAESQSELTKQQLDRANVMVDAGVANESVSLNLKAQLANDRVQIVNAQNQIQLAYNSMINLLQLDLDQPFEVELITLNTTPELPTESVAEVYELALINLPEIRQSELNVVQAELNTRVANSNYFPTLSAYANLNSVYSDRVVTTQPDGTFDVVPIGVVTNTQEEVVTLVPNVDAIQKPFSDQVKDNFGQTVGVSLQIPIFNNMRTKTAVENARLNEEIASFSKDMVLNQLRSDITTAYTSMTAAKSRYDASLISENAQKTNYDFSQKRFEGGLINSVDLLNAKNAWFQSQIQLTNAKYDYVFRKMVIDFYKGEQLKLK